MVRVLQPVAVLPEVEQQVLLRAEVLHRMLVRLQE
jgi:hypothetical protein